MKRYVFKNIDSFELKVNYSIAAISSLLLIYGFTMSLVLCNIVALLGATIFLRYRCEDSYILNDFISSSLEHLIKTNNFYTVENSRLVYAPEVYYSYDESFIYIKFRLDGSRYREFYLTLENLLQDLLLLECVSKEESLGYVIYKFDRLSADRLNISTIKALDSDIIPIDTKLAWNYRKSPHALICGVTGKGKTCFLAYLIKVFTLLKANFKIIDPKLSDLSYLENIYRNNVVSKPLEIAKVLRETVQLMNDRYETFKHLLNYSFGKDFKDYGFKPVFIVFDEVAAFMAAADKKLSKEIEDYMSEIILKGRQAGVFMILTTQRPDADVIKTSIRDQLCFKVAFGQMSKTGYTMIFGSDFNDLELLDSSTGSGYVYIDGVHTKPVQFKSPLFENNYDFVKDLRDLFKK